MNAANSNRVSKAFELAKSFLASRFSVFDAVDMAMRQYGLSYEDGAEAIFDHLAHFISI